tara:strand:- start:424 stop:723 length:300 start_codon:yes stop_codon:yes gene_type:complete
MILTTCSTEADAGNLASALVEKKLAACAQIHPVTSVYTWEGEVHKDPEFRLIIKTKSSLYDRVEHFIRENHSYEVPQIVMIPMGKGLSEYLNWIDETTL